MTASSSSSETDATPSTGPRRLGRYALRYLVAKGGMASVYLAQLSSADGFKKWLAIKTIHTHIASNKRFVAMFLNEARLAARLDHPNICTVFDSGETDGVYYLAMEYLHGESLHAVARRAWQTPGGLPLDRAARIVADAGRGLHAAHELLTEDGRPAGVVHRDVSPQNIFVLYGGVSKVVDFGIARSAEHVGEGTATGELKGKLAYMAPEQIQNVGVDRRTDVWALGIVLWEITVGRRLFRRANDPSTMYAVLQDKIPLPSSIRADYPAALEAIVMRALARDVAQRYATAQQMVRELEAYLASRGVPAGADEVGETMHALFEREIAARDELLRRQVAPGALPEHIVISAEGSSSGGEPANEDDAVPTVIDRHEDTTSAVALIEKRARDITPTGDEPLRTQSDDRAPAVSPQPPASAGNAPVRSRSKIAVPLVAIAITLAIGVGALAVRVSRSGAPPSRAVPSHEPPRVASVTQSPPVAIPAPIEHATLPAVVVEPPAPTPMHDVSIAPIAGAPAPSRVRAAATTHAGDRANARPATADAATGRAPGTSPTSLPGTLTIFSAVPVTVYEGTHSLGDTPISEVRLSPGRHTLRVVPRDGSEAHEQSVEIEPGAASMLRLR